MSSCCGMSDHLIGCCSTLKLGDWETKTNEKLKRGSRTKLGASLMNMPKPTSKRFFKIRSEIDNRLLSTSSTCRFACCFFKVKIALGRMYELDSGGAPTA